MFFESYPTKMCALVSPPSIVGMLEKNWFVASALFLWWTLRTGLGDLKRLRSCDEGGNTPCWVVCLKVQRMISAGILAKYFQTCSQSLGAGVQILDLIGACAASKSVVEIPTSA